MEKRKAFNFLRSYYDCYKAIPTDKDKLQFLNAILEKQFEGKEPENLDVLPNALYEGQKHALNSSLNGFINKTNWRKKMKESKNKKSLESTVNTEDSEIACQGVTQAPTEGVAQAPCQGVTQGVTEGVTQTPYQQEKEKEEEKEKEKEEEKEKEKEKLSNRTIKERSADFKKSLEPYLEKYGNDMLNKFYLYWTEKKPKGRKMLFEMQKTWDVSRRLARWKNNGFDDNSNNQKNNIDPSKFR